MIPSRYTAGDLEIKNPAPYPVAANALAHDDCERGGWHGQRYPKLVERPLQPSHVARLVNDPALPDFTHLINSIGELITAILDVDHRAMAREVPAVHIRDPQQFLPQQSNELLQKLSLSALLNARQGIDDALTSRLDCPACFRINLSQAL